MVVSWEVWLVSCTTNNCWYSSPRWSLADKVNTMKDPYSPTEENQTKMIVKLRLQRGIKRWEHTLSQPVAVRRGPPPVGQPGCFFSECHWQDAHRCPCSHPWSSRCSSWPWWPSCARATLDWQVPVGKSAKSEDMLTVVATFYWLKKLSSS